MKFITFKQPETGDVYDRPDGYFLAISPWPLFVWFESDSNGRHISYFRAPCDYSLISYSFDNQMYLFGSDVIIVIIVIAACCNLVTSGRDECHGFVIKCRRIHYKRLRDLLWMSSEGINMWGNEGFGLIFQFWPFVRLIGSSWSRYSTTIQYSVWLIGWLDDPLDHSSFCCHLSLQYRGISVHSNCSFKTDNRWARC